MGKVGGHYGINRYFEFRTLITPNIIKACYFFGAFIITALSIFLILSPEEGKGITYGILILVFGNILWRVMCEVIILLFSLHDVAVSIEARGKLM